MTLTNDILLLQLYCLPDYKQRQIPTAWLGRTNLETAEEDQTPHFVTCAGLPPGKRCLSATDVLHLIGFLIIGGAGIASAGVETVSKNPPR